jgi:hypothetical protein
MQLKRFPFQLVRARVLTVVLATADAARATCGKRWVFKLNSRIERGEEVYSG